MIALVYVPSLVIRTILFALMVYRFFTSSVKMQTDSFLWRFLKRVCLSMNVHQINILIACGGVFDDGGTITNESACTLAATSHIDPEWLLNNAELSRVHWRRGNVAGEIVVEAGESTIPLDVRYP